MTGKVKSRVKPFFFFSFWGVQKTILVFCLAWPVLSVHSNDFRLRQVLCITSMLPGSSTVILSRRVEKEPLPMIQMSLFDAIVPWPTSNRSSETSMISYMCNKYKHTDNCSKIPVVFRLYCDWLGSRDWIFLICGFS